MSVDLSIVVAVYNEDPRNLMTLLDRVKAAMGPTGLTYEMVFVNDGSRPPTAKALREISQQTDYCKLIVLSRNFGQQAAITAGLEHCAGRAVVNIDSDCQDPPEIIPDMIKAWQEGYHVVYAQRSSRKDRFAKRFSAFVFYRLLGMVSSIDIPWDTGDFRLMDRKVVDALNALPERTRFLRGQVPWLGFRQKGIPIERNAREMGESTYNLRKLFQLAADGLLAFSVAPLYILPVVGLVLMALGFAGLFAACVFAAGLSQWMVAAIVISAMFVLTGIQVVVTGLVAVYLTKVLDEVRRRPTYVVQELLGAPFVSEGKGTAGGVSPQSNKRVSGRELADINGTV